MTLIVTYLVNLISLDYEYYNNKENESFIKLSSWAEVLKGRGLFWAKFKSKHVQK